MGASRRRHEKVRTMETSANTVRSPSGRLPSLTGMRFLAAFAVFGFHIRAQNMFELGSAADVIDVLFSQGAVGVSFFFVLSGFILTWSARRDDTATSIWRRRAARILPSHAATWMLALIGLGLLSSRQTEPWVAAVNLALLQAWVPHEDVYFSLNTPVWSLSCEAFFYTMFPVLIKVLYRIHRRHLWPVAGLLVTATIAMPAVTFVMPSATAYWFVYIFPVTRALEFLLGMTMARIVMSGLWIDLGLWKATGLLVASYIGSSYLPGAFGYVAGTVVAFALLIPAAAVSDLTNRPSAWRARPIVWLGEVSFAFYVVHQLVIRFLAKTVVPEDGLPTGAASAVSIVMLVVAILGAWLLCRVVERPMNRILARRETPPTATPVPDPQ